MLKFFKKPAFGLDISDFSIEVLELTSRNKVGAFARIKLEEGIIKDGFVPNREKLTEKIRKAINEAGVKSNQVVVSLPESKVFIHIFRVPKNLKNQELKELISSQAAKAISLESDKIYWDYQVISTSKEEKEVLYIGTLKEIIDTYYVILKELGLEPVVFELESIALQRALSQSKDFFSALKTENKPKEARNILIIDIGSRTTNINIFDNRNSLRLSSVVQVAGNNFNKAIEEKMKVSSDSTEKLKKANGFSKTKDKGKVADILKEEARPIIDAVKKSLEFYKNPVGEIYLVGGSSTIPKISEYFSESLETEVNLGESFLAKELSIKGVKPVLFNTVVGLALRGLEKNPGNSGMNLLPGTKKGISLPEVKNLNRPKGMPVGKIIFSLIVLVFLGWISYTYILNDPVPEEKPAEEKPVVNEEIPEEPEIIEATSTPEVIEEVEKVTISDTETGWLNVRKGPGTNYEIITKVYPDESYVFLEESLSDENEEWYKIELNDEQEGWVFSEYANRDE